MSREFFELCDHYEHTLESAPRGFMCDARGLKNYAMEPPGPLYSSNGRDKRMEALIIRPRPWHERISAVTFPDL